MKKEQKLLIVFTIEHELVKQLFFSSDFIMQSKVTLALGFITINLSTQCTKAVNKPKGRRLARACSVLAWLDSSNYSQLLES